MRWVTPQCRWNEINELDHLPGSTAGKGGNGHHPSNDTSLPL